MSEERPRGPVTPDGRYFAVRGRLWRMSDPSLAPDTRIGLVSELMAARRGVKEALRNKDGTALRHARSAVDRTKRALGERGPVWWHDGAPDYNRRMAINTPYAQWFEGLTA
ncbi:hypothetical protein [Sphingopyxis sp. KK2]|uniref:hypothetical protein n=1 Tax=Sphingopyxis sp. KK2 TaxID=1855727 RepID=UPI002742642F|nr:hypothetical protein [Sphingopyxis sp. KK2]